MAIKESVQPFAAIANAEPAIKGVRNPELIAVQNFFIRFGYLEEKNRQAAGSDPPISKGPIKYQGTIAYRQQATSRRRRAIR